MSHTTWECRSCRVLFAGEFPDDARLAAFYDGFLYRKPDAAALRRRIAARKHELARVFGLDGTEPPGRRFLDYGGGTGVAFQAARELGLEAFLFEIDGKALDYVRHTFDAGAAHLLGPGDLDRPAPFDLILVDNVIEHVRQPIELVDRLHGLLAPGGRMVIKTPLASNSEMYFYPEVALGGYARQALRYNPAGDVLRALWSRRLWTCDPPRHLFAFSASGLETVSRRAGVPADAITISYYRVPLFEYSLVKKIVSRPHRWQGVVSRVAALPLAAIELLSKLVQAILRSTGMLSPGGLIVTIRKRAASTAG